MIIVKIFGGLGNQLFQYALALKLAKKKDSKVVFDLSWFNSKTSFATKREFELKYFNTSLNYNMSLYDKFKLLFYNNKVLKYIPINKKLNILGDNDEINFNKIDNVYLNGYWHSHSYFNDIKKSLFIELSLNSNFDISSDLRSKIITNNNSVSVHIRRTDYINNQFYAQCSMKYFQNAMQLIAEKINNPVFFIFSDDLEYVKKNLITNQTVYFSTNQNLEMATVEDFFNMQSCKHHIISNSTFSWWASWLNPNPNKIVVIPKHWYANPGENSSGYYLDSYIILDNVH